jgi:hypothetical protein
MDIAFKIITKLSVVPVGKANPLLYGLLINGGNFLKILAIIQDNFVDFL